MGGPSSRASDFGAARACPELVEGDLDEPRILGACPERAKRPQGAFGSHPHSGGNILACQKFNKRTVELLRTLFVRQVSDAGKDNQL